MECKHKHLEFIQAVISRMGNNSFFIKGWTITIIAALFALSAKDADKGFLRLSYYPILIFWFLDSFYLRQERLFRHLYNKIRLKNNEDDFDFDMSTEEFKKESNVKIHKVLFASTEWLFYLSLIVIVLIVKYLLNFH